MLDKVELFAAPLISWAVTDGSAVMLMPSMIIQKMLYPAERTAAAAELFCCRGRWNGDGKQPAPHQSRQIRMLQSDFVRSIIIFLAKLHKHGELL